MQTFIIILLAAILILLIFLVSKTPKLDLKSLETGIIRIESSVKNEIVTNRSETNESAKHSREELSNTLKHFGEQMSGSMREVSTLQKSQLETFSTNLNTLTKSIEDKLNSLTSTVETKLTALAETSSSNAKEGRKELKEVLESFKKDSAKSLTDFNTSQKDSFITLMNKQGEQNNNTSVRLDQMRETIEKKINDMQTGNEKKLDEMRLTVDEKLQKTLETRLGESFKLVSERLEAVHKGLGDMQQLATGVGDLKKVLSNVKTRGILGEYQLENILEQILTSEQYSKNVKTKDGSNDSVEFAIKLPG